MPDGLKWNETSRAPAPGMLVAFDGPSAPATRAWIGLIAALTSLPFGKLVFEDPQGNPSWVKALPILFGAAGIALIVQGVPGAHKGRIEVDAARLRVVPSSPFALEVEVPLAQIDYFSSDTEETDYEVQTAGGRTPLREMRFRVFVYRADGRRHALAMFGDRSAAMFMAQRLDGLVERARTGRIG